jgi:glycine hydroxymethyltransferase
MHVIAAKAVAFGEALRPEFEQYSAQVIKNAQALAGTLMAGGLDIVTGGTDTHVMLVDLRPKGVKGNDTEKALGRAHITCNKNGVPFDPEKPMVTSGVRLGTPAGTTRGFGEDEFRLIRPEHDTLQRSAIRSGQECAGGQPAFRRIARLSLHRYHATAAGRNHGLPV